VLLLDTNDKLQLVTGTATSVDVIVSFVEASTADPPVVKGSTMATQKTAISTATTTDICAVAAASSVRNVKTIHIRNKGATATDVTVVLDDNGTDYELWKANLDAGEHLEYIEGVGFFEPAASKAFYNRRVASSDFTTTSTTFVDVTGLTVPVVAGRHYNLEAHLFGFTSATTVGFHMGVGGVAMTGMRIQALQVVTGSVTAAAMSANVADVTAVDTVAVGQTTGPATNPVLHILSGWINPSASGTFAVRVKNEVAGTLTVKVGSWAQVWEVD
jgi:hypothetical protein